MLLKPLRLLKQWLLQRGLEISDEKTRIVHIDDGFDFLGFNLRQYKGKLMIKPQKEKVLAFCKKVGQVLSKTKASKQEDLIKILNPLLRGFANYYRGVVSKETFQYIGHRVYQHLYRWAKRRHPNKGKKWVFKRYFGSYRGNNYAFMCKGTDRRGNEKFYRLYEINKTPIIRHIKVKGTASPDDCSLQEYWQNRSREYGKKYWAKGSKYEQLAKLQDWKCPICGDSLFNSEEIETHHIVPVSEGGLDDVENLMHLHRACHKQVHSKSKLNGLK